jgi:hypothetical protein
MKDVLIQVYGVWYIDPIRFLQHLEERASLVLERIAVPGTDHATTEALRGRRAELQTLIQQLTEITK